MIAGVYINLPVANVAASRAFFTGLGLVINEDFSNDTAIAVALGPSSAAMLLSRDFFQTFTPLPIADARAATQVLVALQLGSRADVDAMASRAFATGGSRVRDPQDHGFMYAHAFADIDGHVWEPFWMNDEVPTAD
jgi:uncharacterized protein